MARILFIESDLRNEKLGIMYLSAALKVAGHDTLLCWLERDNLHALITEFRPDFLALSLTTGIHDRLLTLATELKKKYPIKVIVGGPHATFFSNEIPSEAADYVVVGQGERTLVNIVEQKITERIVTDDLLDLNALPFPDRELFYRFTDFRDNPMKNVITCRDCPYSCSYCYNHTWKEKFRGQRYFMQRRTVGNVLSELTHLKDNYHVERILFIDDNFLINRSWIEHFSNRYYKEIGLPFLCSFSLNLLDEEILSTLKKAGLFMVNFALESADPKVQKEILNRSHVNNKQIEHGIHLLKQYDIKIRMQNMIGLPVMNPLEDALNTLHFNMMNKVDDSWVSIYQPYRNTRLADYCLKQGYVADDAVTFAESFFDKSNLKIDHPEKIRRLQKWWYFIIRYDMTEGAIAALLQIDLNEQMGIALQDLRYAYSRNYLYGMNDLNPRLEHHLDTIKTAFRNKRNFDRLETFIKKFRLGYGLVEILLNLEITDSILLDGA